MTDHTDATATVSALSGLIRAISPRVIPEAADLPADAGLRGAAGLPCTAGLPAGAAGLPAGAEAGVLGEAGLLAGAEGGVLGEAGLLAGAKGGVLGEAAPRRTIVGIAGPPGAGKTTVAESLVAHLGPSAQLVSMDGYHLPQDRLRQLGRRERMGAADTFDIDAFVHLLRRLRASHGAEHASGFDRDHEEPTPGSVTIAASTRVIVVEGNYLLADTGGWERVLPLLDVSVYLRLPDDVRLARLIARHERFGKTAADSRAWATGPDQANARFIEATAHRADHQLRLE